MTTEEDSTQNVESRLFDAIALKNLDQVKQIVKDNPKINLDCLDKDELTPLQHACHIGDLDLATYLINHGANVNYTNRKDGYTPIMFAAIGGRAEIVQLMLRHGVDLTVENCVNRNVVQMAAFVGQTKIVAIINNWIPFKDSIEPFIYCRELEDKPRIPSPKLGKVLHDYIIYPSINPIKLLIYIRENLELMQYAKQFIYVLEKLSSKSMQPPQNEECQSLKYYYLSYLLDYCLRLNKSKKDFNQNSSSGLDDNLNGSEFDKGTCAKNIDALIRRLVKREKPDEIKGCTKLLDLFLVECIMKFPYTQLAMFKTMAYALTKREPGDYTALSIFTQTLNGPRMFGNSTEGCAVCGELDKNKKCSNCKSIYYCGQLCQKADWFQHKKVCTS